ncbi:MAG TPA: PAS domain-containing protein [Stellaceae bacterium]|nr:PAS domain-containing protein [Stellaceae bacterium]
MQSAALKNVAEPWHPDIAGIHDYWRSIHPGTGLPGRQHVDALEIPRELLPRIWLLDIQAEPFRLRYRLVGTEIVRAIGREVTGQWLDDAHPHLKDEPDYLARYREVLATGMPSWRRGRAMLWTHQDYREIENILLPLARDGASVDMIMVLTVLYRWDRQREAESAA